MGSISNKLSKDAFMAPLEDDTLHALWANCIWSIARDYSEAVISHISLKYISTLQQQQHTQTVKKGLRKQFSPGRHNTRFCFSLKVYLDHHSIVLHFLAIYARSSHLLRLNIFHPGGGARKTANINSSFFNDPKRSKTKL